jgi:hypothetical protein
MPTNALEHWAITGNIARFQAMLENETDETKHAHLKDLLALEMAKLRTPDGDELRAKGDAD